MNTNLMKEPGDNGWLHLDAALLGVTCSDWNLEAVHQYFNHHTTNSMSTRRTLLRRFLCVSIYSQRSRWLGQRAGKPGKSTLACFFLLSVDWASADSMPFPPVLLVPRGMRRACFHTGERIVVATTFARQISPTREQLR